MNPSSTRHEIRPVRQRDVPPLSGDPEAMRVVSRKPVAHTSGLLLGIARAED